MKQTPDNSIRLSQIAVGLAALLLLALDIGVVLWMKGWTVWRGVEFGNDVALAATIESGSVFAWIALARLWRLLGNLRRGEVFTAQNVSCLRTISWCCVGASAVSLLGTLRYLPFAFMFVAAGFMALIVRVVKNVFEQAIVMKSELDLTI